MTTVIVAEKPSAARNMAAALGGATGQYQGVQYRIAHLRGHLYEFVPPNQPAAVVSTGLHEKYKSWDVANLPWDASELSWKREPRGDVARVIADLNRACSAATEIVIATDLDPSGEGDLLFWEAADELNLAKPGVKISRMEFLDESPASLQKAFAARRPVRSMWDEANYRKALYRAQWDYLSMQFTRAATAASASVRQNTVLRQGRLKSVMVALVGDQQERVDSYVKKPFFQNRFKDENGVVYTDPEEPRYPDKTSPPQKYHASAIVKDSVTPKRKGPPPLRDLAALSGHLARHGVGAKTVLQVYQQMYEAQVVSYPRTEDHFASRRNYRLSHIDHHARQLIRPDMGVRVPQYLLACAVENEPLQRPRMVAAFLRAREEFTVRECSRTALAECVIRVGVDLAAAVYLRNIAFAFAHRFATFEYYRPQSQFDKPQRTEHPRRSRADDHDLRPRADILIIETSGRRQRLALDEHFDGHIDLHPATARVDRLLHHTCRRDLLYADPGHARRDRHIYFFIGRLPGRQP